MPDTEPIPTPKPVPKLGPSHEAFFVSDGLLQQAEQVCKRRLAQDPDNVGILASLGQNYRKQGNLAEAAIIYKRLTTLNPEDQVAAYVHAILAGTDVSVMPAGIRPAPFVLLKNFLPESFHETLLPFVLANQEKLVPARVASGAYKPDARESLDLPGEWEVKKRFHQRIRPLIAKVAPRLHVAPFQIGQLEVKVRAYTDGHFFRVHMDCPRIPEDVSLRAVSYVYFFHKLPRAYSGGDLLLFDSDPDVEKSDFTTAAFTRVVPEDNSIVIFPSAYWHSVIPVSCPSKEFADSRFVINGHVSKVAPKSVVEAPAGPATSERGVVAAFSPPEVRLTT